MKLPKVRPEVVTREVSAALIAAMKTLHNVVAGVKITSIQCEAEELSSGVGYTLRIQIQITENKDPSPT
jgi:hypothetical protein